LRSIELQVIAMLSSAAERVHGT